MIVKSGCSSPATEQSSVPQMFNQPVLNDLVCDLAISKKAVALLAPKAARKRIYCTVQQKCHLTFQWKRTWLTIMIF